MKNHDAYAHSRMEDAIAVCGGNPHDYELPQIGSETDVLLDVCSELMNLPREYTAACINHQWNDVQDHEEAIH